MKGTLGDGVLFNKEKKRNGLFLSAKERKNDVIAPKFLRVNIAPNTKGKLFQAVQHPEVIGTWAEVLATAKEYGYDGMREESGLRRKKTFPKVAVEV